WSGSPTDPSLSDPSRRGDGFPPPGWRSVTSTAEGAGQAADDVGRALRDVGGRELEHLEAELLQLDPPLGIALQVDGGAVVTVPHHLDDDALSLPKGVHPHDPFATKRDLCARRREPSVAHEGEEAPFQVGVTDRSGQRGAEDGHAPAAAELSDATGQHLLGGPAVAHRGADGGGQLPLVDAGGDVDDRAGPARQVETSHRDDVGTGEDLRRVYPGQRRPRPTTTWHGQLDGSGAEAVETEQAGGGEMRHDGLVTNGQYRRLHGPLPRRLVPGQAVHALAEVIEPTGGDAAVELARREAG